jgi:hypothetical protein
VWKHLNCTRGLQFILTLGSRRYRSIWNASTFTGAMPSHKSAGKTSHNSVMLNECKYEPLRRHFEYLLNLGEVRAMQVVATLINGMNGRANCNNG